MAEDKKNVSEVPKVSENVVLTNDQLFKMLIDTQKEAANSNRLLAEALLESRKPYIDPAVLAQKQQALKEKQAAVAFELRKRVATKEQCPHLRTNSDDSFGDKLNIKWMEHSNGIILGVCGTCFSQFDARNPKDLALLRKDGAAMKNMGRARENVRLGM